MIELSTNKPGVLVVTISFKYNFLAEGIINCLQSDPSFDWPVMAINVGKSLVHASELKTQDKIKNVFFSSRQLHHSTTLNALTLSDSFYSQTKGYDWLLMIDHDVFFTGRGFQPCVEKILTTLGQPGDAGEPLLVVPFSGFPGKIFNTNPIMLVNIKEEARFRWKQCQETWNAKPNWTCDGDTGQLLGQELITTGLVRRFKTVDALPATIHIGSSWYTVGAPSHSRSVAMLIQTHREGLIHPSREDIELMTADGINPAIINELLPRTVFSSL